jgi:hypothetical protein
MNAAEQENPTIAKDSEDAFSYIAKGEPKDSKFARMRNYVDAYGPEALAYLKDEIFVAGYQVIDIARLKSEKPHEYSRLLSLAYALTLYKEDGFMAAMDIIRSGVVLREEEAPKALPTIYFIASTAIMGMADKGIVNKKSAFSMLDIMINDADTKPMEKAIFLEFAIHIDPGAIKAYKESKIPAVKTIAEARLEEK